CDRAPRAPLGHSASRRCPRGRRLPRRRRVGAPGRPRGGRRRPRGGTARVSHVRGAPPSTPEQIPASIKAEIERTTWLDFACIVLVLVGVMNIIGGLSAITGANYVIDHLLFANLHAWGWLVLIWGILQLFAAAAVYRGAPWGAVVAIAT